MCPPGTSPAPGPMATMLTPEQIERASELLEDVRRAGKTLPCIPEECRPETLADAYAVQDRLASRLGWEIGGWFCACTNADIQRMLGLAEPYCARLFARLLHAGPATLRSAEMPPVVLECEFAFTLGRDLPARGAPYGRAEVAAAVRAVHPAIEVVAGHLDDWPNQDVFSVIADNGTDGALVYGAAVAGWRELDLAGIGVSLTVNGERVREGSGRNVAGDPLGALIWLANPRSAAGDGLAAGHIHNTGTATGIYWTQPGDHATADFGPLGQVTLHMV